MPLGVQYSGMWTLAQQFQAVGAGTWKNIVTDELYAWGLNSDGQLGDSTVIHKSSPIQVDASTTWSSIAAGSAHSVALKTDGTMWSWGRNGYGTLGDNTDVYRSSPVQVGALTTWSSVSTGYLSTLALRTDGTLWAWGFQGNGTLGINELVVKSSPIQVGALTNWSKIASNKHSMAISHEVS